MTFSCWNIIPQYSDELHLVYVKNAQEVCRKFQRMHNMATSTHWHDTSSKDILGWAAGISFAVNSLKCDVIILSSATMNIWFLQRLCQRPSSEETGSSTGSWHGNSCAKKMVMCLLGSVDSFGLVNNKFLYVLLLVRGVHPRGEWRTLRHWNFRGETAINLVSWFSGK